MESFPDFGVSGIVWISIIILLSQSLLVSWFFPKSLRISIIFTIKISFQSIIIDKWSSCTFWSSPLKSVSWVASTLSANQSASTLIDTLIDYHDFDKIIPQIRFRCFSRLECQVTWNVHSFHKWHRFEMILCFVPNILISIKKSVLNL